MTTSNTNGEPPIRVAIVGGGCAGMTTAFELSRPEHQGRYAVTVYQVGWRLGGKGASGRGPAGRIEEHGLHLWMGCYENAFRLMRECYAELARDPRQCPIAGWRDAFVIIGASLLRARRTVDARDRRDLPTPKNPACTARSASPLPSSRLSFFPSRPHARN